jgi:DNA-binding NtrC family response regulator
MTGLPMTVETDSDTVQARVAIVDDEPRMGRVLSMVLRRDGHDVVVYASAEAMLAAMDDDETDPVDLLLTDLSMPGMDGVALLAAARQRRPDLPVILITAHATVATAVDAMKKGAVDYLRKPIDNEVCRAAVRRALAHTRLARENRVLRAQLAGKYGLHNIIAVSHAMLEVLALARRAARSRATVLIQGDSGTGKEVIARAVHFESDRVGGPFVAVNCKAFGAGVLESELFGHEKGAFTGADRARPGIFERAHGGTLLLDEIGEIGPDFQGKLLRVLQEKEVLRVGSQAPRSVDVRVVAATNKDLAAEVRAGRFREDLYFRLAVIPLQVPPLRERADDVLPLARHFLAHMAAEQGRTLTGWSNQVEAWLQRHDWPGNVRELENTIERAVVLAREDEIQIGDLLVKPHPDSDTGNGTAGTDTLAGAGGAMGLQAWLDHAAAEHIRAILNQTGGVRVEAARRLGIERTTLYRLIKKYNLSE